MPIYSASASPKGSEIVTNLLLVVGRLMVPWGWVVVMGLFFLYIYTRRG